MAIPHSFCEEIVDSGGSEIKFDRMGERWFANTLSFADVTIGAARLQETVRALDQRRSMDARAYGDRILLVVPHTEHHTLGVFVASQQFRRRGVDVPCRTRRRGTRQVPPVPVGVHNSSRT